jgi:hypothetical protein
MNGNGFLRKTLLIGVITWAFLNYLLSDDSVVHNPAIRSFGKVAILAIAISGVITLLQQRMPKE